MGHPLTIKQTDSQMKITVNDMAYIISDKPLTLTQTQQSGVTPLMSNGNFEDVTGDIDMAGLEAGKPSHWTMRRTDYDPKGNVLLSRDARTGKFAMQVSSSGAGRVYLFEDVKIPAPGDYLFTAHIKKSDAASSAIAYMSYYDRDHNVIKLNLLPEIGTDYQLCRMVIHFDQAPPSPVALIVGVNKGSGEVLIDDVDIQAVEPMRILPQHSWNMPLKNKGNWPLSDNLKDNDRAIMLSELGCLSKLPTLGGVCFDLPGTQDHCVLVASSDWPGTTTQVNAMPVERKFTRMAFVQTCMYIGKQSGTQLGQYIIRYADGTEIALPIRLDQDIRDWFVPAQTPMALAPKPAYIFNTANGVELSVFTMFWDNPQPDKIIQSIDLQSNAPGVLCLLSVTGETAH
jgi:hypothetical protein